MAVVGARKAVRGVLKGLQRLEYRGYDSCGYVYPQNGTLQVVKSVGGVANLVAQGSGEETLALGHTRWATHGGVTQPNAHPHTDCAGRIAVVHNGIIENHADLRRRLEGDGHTFRSETDTEILPHLLEELDKGDLLEALRGALREIRGSYSIAAIRTGSDAVVFAKNSTPLIVGVNKDGGLLASDPNALAGLAEKVAYIEDGQFGRVTPKGIELFDARGPIEPKWVQIAWAAEESDKAGFAHYMLKEIYESPQVLNRTMSGRAFFGPPYIHVGIPPEIFLRARRVKLIGAGTSHHACLLGAAFLRSLAGLPAQAELAPEYKDLDPHEEPQTVVVAVSQSGETLDTLEAIKAVEGHGAPLVAVTNNPHSAIARRADAVVALNAGPEIGVAATKTFLAQVTALLMLAIEVARQRGRIGISEVAGMSEELKRLPRVFANMLNSTEAFEESGRYLAKFGHAFVLGKGLLLHAAQEGALKLKEIAYQHAEAYSAGELKHGPFALLTADTPVIFLISATGSPDKILNNVMEVKARGSPTILLTSGHIPSTDGLTPHIIQLPRVHELLEPLVFGSALHLLSYVSAKQRGCEIDRPRNLAKSVTVE
ncbi:MAG TPA: glutamine--fructose-6-phosphate transaminase (isomerizing) [Candidatus Thermoplasmatota archaeon]